jgi:hypothetical protein
MKTVVLKRLSLLLGIVAVVASCGGDRMPTAPAMSSARPEADLLGGLLKATGLLSCRPMAPAYASQTIGPSGGVIHVGAHTFTVPAGALRSSVTISAYAPSDKYNQIEFQPSGLQFSRPASLTMSYANCSLLGDLLPKHIAYVDEHLNILSLLLSVDNLLTQKVTGQVNHFSDYALAW